MEDPRRRAPDRRDRAARRRATHQWDAYVTTHVRGGARRTSAGCPARRLLRLARVYESELARCGARGGGATCGAQSSTTRTPTRWPRSIASTRAQGMYEDLAEHSAPAASAITDDTDEQRRASTSASARLRRRARATAIRRSPATRRCSSTTAQPRARSRRWSGSTSAASTGASCSRSTRRWSTSRSDDEPGRQLRAHGQARGRRARQARPRRSSCGAACSTSAAKSRRRSPRSPICTSTPAKWEELVEILERQVAVAAAASASRSRCTSTSARSGATSCARAQRARRVAQGRSRSIATTSRRCARSRASTAPTQAWDELSQTLRRIIEVGQLARQRIDEHETIELYAQLGQLEGDVLGRVDEAVDAWRQVIAIDPRTSARSRRSSACSCARRAGKRRSTCSRSARSCSTTTEQRRERCCRPPRRGKRRSRTSTRARAGLRARALRSIRRTSTASDRARGDLPPAVQVDRARRALARARPSSRPTSSSRSSSSTRSAEIYESEIGDQESAFYVLAGRVQARLLARSDARASSSASPRRPTAGRSCSTSTRNRVNELEREIAARPRTCG